MKKMGKKIHRITVRVDDDTLNALLKLAACEQKEFSSYCANVLEAHVWGAVIKLPDPCEGGNDFHSGHEPL